MVLTGIALTGIELTGISAVLATTDRESATGPMT
jgi:hypothetical protein